MKPNKTGHVKKDTMRISRKLKKQLKAKHGKMWRWEATGIVMARVCAGSVRALNDLNKAFAEWPTMDMGYPVDGFGQQDQEISELLAEVKAVCG